MTAEQLLSRAVTIRRKALKMTQDELADRAGCGQAIVSRLESGTKMPSVELVAAVLGALGLRLEVVES